MSSIKVPTVSFEFSSFAQFVTRLACFAISLLLSVYIMGKTRGRTGSQSGKSEVELACASEGDLVSLSTLKEMMAAQESLMKSFFESFIESVNTRVDDLVQTVASLKASIEFTQTDVTKLEEVEEAVSDLKSGLQAQSTKAEYLENQSRRNNIRVSGIAESLGETWDEAEEKVRAAIKEKLNMEVDIERAHRVERRKDASSHRQAEKPRTVVCRLRCWKQKEAVLHKARRIKPEGLFICEDLAFATLQKRINQLDKLKEAKRAGKTAFFILDRLVIRNKTND